MSLGCVLLATIGGFGDFFNTFVAPDIRCYNRIVPFLSFFAIVAVAVMMQTVKERWWAWSRMGFTALVIAVVAFAAVDQPVTTDYLLHDARAQLFHSDAEFVHLIESRLPAGAAIFQLPYAEFPVEQLRERMFNNDHGRPYLHASNSRWSWGGVSGTTPAEWNKEVASLAIPNLVHRLMHQGYLGVWIDLFGYKSEESPEAALKTVLRIDPVRSENARYLFFDLRPYIDRMSLSEKAMSAELLRSSHPIEVTYERGLYSPDLPREMMWSSGRHGRIMLINPLEISRSVTVSMIARALDRSAQHLQMTEGNITDNLTVSGAQPYSRKVNLPPKSLVPLDLYCPCDRFVLQSRPRPLYFGIQGLKITE